MRQYAATHVTFSDNGLCASFNYSAMVLLYVIYMKVKTAASALPSLCVWTFVKKHY